jgi:hypothetical protein
MSALSPKADIAERDRYVRVVSIADIKVVPPVGDLLAAFSGHQAGEMEPSLSHPTRALRDRFRANAPLLFALQAAGRLAHWPQQVHG